MGYELEIKLCEDSASLNFYNMYVRCSIHMWIFWKKKDVVQSRYDQCEYFILIFTLLYNSCDVFNGLHVCMVMSI